MKKLFKDNIAAGKEIYKLFLYIVKYPNIYNN